MQSSLAGRPWLSVGLLWLAALLNYLDRLMHTTMRDPLVADIGMSDAQFGLLTSVFLWVYGVASPVAGYLADRLGRSVVIIVSLLLWSAVTALTGLAQSVEQLVATRALLGLSQACYIPAALALIADLHPGPTRSLATGVHASGIYAGAALGGVGGVISERFGWRAGFEWLGLFGIGYALLLVFFLRDRLRPTVAQPAATEPAGVRVRAGDALRVLAGQPGFWVLLLVCGLVGIANWGIYGWLPTYMREQFKLGLGAAGMMATGYIQVSSFAGVLLGGALADRWSRTQPRARALLPAIGYCAVAPSLFLGVISDVLPVLIAGLIVFGLGRGFFDANLMPILRTVADERFSATGFGCLNFVSVLLGGALVYVGGWLKDAQVPLASVFLFSAAGLLVVGLLLLMLQPQASPPPAVEVPAAPD